MEGTLMNWITQLTCFTTMTASLGLGSLTFAQDQLAPKPLELSGLLTEALAQNPEVQAARQQWEAASERITQARSLDDPTLSVQWWNAPESFNLGQAQNTIIGLSQKFPFPGKLALKEKVASRSAEITEQALRAKERDLIARMPASGTRRAMGLPALAITTSAPAATSSTMRERCVLASWMLMMVLIAGSK